MKLNAFLAGVILSWSTLAYAGEGSKEIAWQDYSAATTAAKKANKPVLLDFWRPG